MTTSGVNAADEHTVRAAIVRVCQRLWARELVAGRDGNVSARLGRDELLVTPAGFSKVDVTEDDLVVLSTTGSHLRGDHKASSEIALHLRAYARRPDVGAVVHAHPPCAIALGLAGGSVPDDVLPEVAVLLGSVPLVRYAIPGSEELADQFEPHWPGHDAFLMANHGALTLGATLSVAHQRMETLEHTARIVTTARALGRVGTLTTEQVSALRRTREGR